MKMSEAGEPGLCRCGNVGVYPRFTGSRTKVYWRCRECHRELMRVYMKKYYQTPEGKAKVKASTKRWYDKHVKGTK